MISDDAEVRKVVRESLLESSIVKSEKTKEKVGDEHISEKQKLKDKKEIYQVYYDFQIEITKIKPYQTLALNRGEKEKTLKIILSFEHPELMKKMKNKFLQYKESVFMEILDAAIEDSFSRLIFPSIEKEVRNFLTEAADIHAIEIFAAKSPPALASAASFR